MPAQETDIAPEASSSLDRTGGQDKGQSPANASHLSSKTLQPLAPGLYLVATPIGHLRDLTLRALDTLAAADLILCEDTRVTSRLLDRYSVHRPLEAYHEHNAARMRPRILGRLAEGAAVALVSDAGTPLISDPGYRLVGEVVAAGIAVTTLPGPSSVLAALTLAALPTDRFLFMGFLPPKQKSRRDALAEIKDVRASLVLLEGPSRLADLLADAALVLGDRPAAVARELTKLYEEVRRESLATLARHYEETGPPKGEVVVVIGPPGAAEAPTADILDAALGMELAVASPSAAAAKVAARFGLPKRDVYQRAIMLKAGNSSPNHE